MPAITVSSVNTTTDELTAVAHGLTTGDRFRLRNVGGALPAATPALAGATDYFALRTGADTLKICDTNAHALAGTGIFDLTGAGSGTTTVEYGLPYCIPTALAAAGTQIKSANDQGAWNSLVALYDLLTGQAQSTYSGVQLAGLLTTLAGINVATGQAVTLSGTATLTAGGLITANAGLTAAANQHVTVSGTGDYKHGARVLVVPAGAASIVTGSPSRSEDHWTAAAAGNVITFPISLTAGRQVSTIVVWYQRTSGTLTFAFTRSTLASASITTIASTTDSGSSGLTSTTITTNHTILSTDQYYLKFTSGAAADLIYGVIVNYTNP